MTIDLFFEYNFSPIVGLIFQMVILLLGKNFTKKERAIFGLTLILEIFELLSYNFEFVFANMDTPTLWRTFFSICGYIARPALVYPFIILLKPKKNSFLDKLTYWDLIPLAVVVIIQQFAYGTQWVFYFTADNHFCRGPLGYISQIVTIMYLVEASVEIITTKVLDKKISVGMVVVILAYIILAIIFESLFDIHSLGISSGVFSIVFFMFALQANHLTEARDKLKTLSEVDSLSKLSNRYFGEQQIDQAIANKTAGFFALLDIDNFKTINDTYGHDIGDEAIKKVAQALKNTVADNDILMRLGGDEFAIYSINVKTYEEAEKGVLKIFDAIHEIRLSADKDYRINISIGLTQYDGDTESTFDKLYKLADNKLYEAKNFKGSHVCY